MPRKPRKIRTIKIPDKQWADWDKYAKARGVSRNQFIKDAVDAFEKANPKKTADIVYEAGPTKSRALTAEDPMWNRWFKIAKDKGITRDGEPSRARMVWKACEWMAGRKR